MCTDKLVLRIKTHIHKCNYFQDWKPEHADCIHIKNMLCQYTCMFCKT